MQYWGEVSLSKQYSQSRNQKEKIHRLDYLNILHFYRSRHYFKNSQTNKLGKYTPNPCDRQEINIQNTIEKDRH